MYSRDHALTFHLRRFCSLAVDEVPWSRHHQHGAEDPVAAPLHAQRLFLQAPDFPRILSTIHTPSPPFFCPHYANKKYLRQRWTSRPNHSLEAAVVENRPRVGNPCKIWWGEMKWHTALWYTPIIRSAASSLFSCHLRRPNRPCQRTRAMQTR